MKKDWFLIVNMIGLLLAVSGSLILSDVSDAALKFFPGTITSVSGARG